MALSLKGTPFGMVSNATSSTFPKGDAYLTWKKLFTSKYEPTKEADLVIMEENWVKCTLKEKTYKDIDEWFYELDRIQEHLHGIDGA